MKKLLDMFQRRFGAIKKEKVYAHLIVSGFFVLILVTTFWGLSVADGVLRPIIVLVAAALTVALIVLITRNLRRPKVKIPVGQKERETYVAAEKPATNRKPTTAELPIVVAERQYPQSVRPTPQPTYFKETAIARVELSNFAKRRIAKNLPELRGRESVFEARKSVDELLIQLEKRKPTGKIVKRRWSKGKTRDVLEPRSTIYGELLFVAISLGILSLPALQGFFALPQWIATIIDPLNQSQIISMALLGLGGILFIWSFLLFYRKWAYWYYWRLILFDANESTNDAARLVIIDKPLLMPGGTTPSVFMQFARIATSATFRSLPNHMSSDADKRSFRSILAGVMGVSWLTVDTYGDQDVMFNWMGPFRNTQILETKINQLIANNRMGDR